MKLSASEVELLAEALDSHIYWQLSDRRYRNNGQVNFPGSDNMEQRKEIRKARKLLDRIWTEAASR